MVLLGLPHAADQLTTDAFTACCAVAHHASRGADDHDPEAVADLGDVTAAGVATLAGLGLPAQALDGILIAMPLEGDAKQPLLAVFLPAEVGDIPLQLEDFGDTTLLLRTRDGNVGVLRTNRVPNPGEHVGDWIGHRH
jgi:hypothetical protein